MQGPSGCLVSCLLAGAILAPSADAAAPLPPLPEPIDHLGNTVKGAVTETVDLLPHLLPTPTPAPTTAPVASPAPVSGTVRPPAATKAPAPIRVTRAAKTRFPRGAATVTPPVAGSVSSSTPSSAPAKARQITPETTRIKPAATREKRQPAARRPARTPSPRPETLRSFVSRVPLWIKLVVGLLTIALLSAVVAILRSRRQLSAALDRAYHDVVTGLPNRAAADETLKQMTCRAQRSGDFLGVVMVDLDNFKSINDVYGHAKGDEVLAEVGLIARRTMRGADFVARFGGEELILILPDTDMDGSRLVAEKLRAALHAADVGNLHPSVTASFGVCAARGGDIALTRLVACADAALYRAKDNGRDRVETAENAVLEPAAA